MAHGGEGFLQKLRASGADQFYMFEQMTAEADQAWNDAAVTIPGAYYWTSGEAPADSCWDPFVPSRGLLRPPPEHLRTIDPMYMEEAIREFTRTGFHGALN